MTKEEIPYSEACERNFSPIKEVLTQYLDIGKLLEMGHGTGQHALAFSASFPSVEWYAADQKDYHWMLKKRMELSPQKNLYGPYELFIESDRSMEEQLSSITTNFDYFFTANTLHIMNQNQVDLFCEQVGQNLKANGLLFIYGPFQYDGQFTSESNQLFHTHLLSQDVGSGIKEFNRVQEKLYDFQFLKRFDLPANNQILVFQKK